MPLIFEQKWESLQLTCTPKHGDPQRDCWDHGAPVASYSVTVSSAPSFVKLSPRPVFDQLLLQQCSWPTIWQSWRVIAGVVCFQALVLHPGRIFGTGYASSSLHQHHRVKVSDRMNVFNLFIFTQTNFANTFTFSNFKKLLNFTELEKTGLMIPLIFSS